MIVCPLYAALSVEQQLSIFSSTPKLCRKVILATNIAETSITIPGIKYVVDIGFVKHRHFDAKKGVSSLLIKPISRSSCRQRAGRAGREGPGECYRLFTEDSFYKNLEEDSCPEILRANLANVILLLKACGTDNIFDFNFLESPSLDILRNGLEELLALKALQNDGLISDFGLKMAECPLPPHLSRVLLEASV